MYSSAYVWAKVLSHMEEKLGSIPVSSWFDDAEVVELNENNLIIYSPSDFRRDIIRRRCTGYVEDALKEVFNSDAKLLVFGDKERDAFRNKGKTISSMDFNPQFTFDNFVVGPSNRFAHSASIAVSKNPGQVYNPLFIYGPSGVGKTHLLYAIAHTIHKNHPDYKIVYIRGEDFTNELIRDIRAGKNQEFRAKYRSADVFLMDDVQFIAGRDSTQEEMFHTFNTLYEDKKQIVFTADRPPKEMLRLEDRLKTRFEWGLLADIQPPDYETRMAIIKNKAIRMGVELPEEVLIYVAENITSNVRQIEGTVKKILAFRDLLGSNVDASSVTRAVRDMFKEPSDILPTAEVIIEEVGKFYDIDPNAIRGQGRTKATSWARHIAIYLTRHMTKLSLKDIGKEFDNRDHTTVLHSIERVEKQCKTDPETNEVIKDIRSNVNERYN